MQSMKTHGMGDEENDFRTIAETKSEQDRGHQPVCPDNQPISQSYIS